ncbi:MAG: NADP-dependent phosphogluconate dehydrogenase [Spirochaetota bacterium]|nr:MAG: NADP-dependent phosphogluconate dehydrogenase [Spirochaetota bacterium]
METQDLGLIGLAVMGQNLVLNMERNGFKVSVFNRTQEKAEAFMNERARGKNIKRSRSIEEFCSSLAQPRVVMLMVKAGDPVDDLLGQLIPCLEQGDIIIDGGNSRFQDTIRRARFLKEKQIHYMGTGISGGEEGALHGPSIMPGGSEEAWKHVKHLLQTIAAKTSDGSPCCEYIGPDGAGHYVKMVHNGIEYGDIQLICEAYHIMRSLLGLSYEKLHQVFTEWNRGDLDSYLIQITSEILPKKDKETGKPMVEVILDRAGQKGTGAWTAQSALDLGIPVPTIAEAVFARSISALKTERIRASEMLSRMQSGSERIYSGDKEEFIDAVHDALYASKVCSYTQGFALMKAASKEYNWNLNYGEIASIWRNGCIIRAKFLDKIKEAFRRNPNLDNLLLDPFFKDIVVKNQKNWRLVISTAANFGIPVPAFTSALSYFDSYRSETLPANLLQAMRDYFGAHTYERVDKEGVFHTDWLIE